jgi:hypothetical protein
VDDDDALRAGLARARATDEATRDALNAKSRELEAREHARRTRDLETQRLTRRFLELMSAAGNPGLRRFGLFRMRAWVAGSPPRGLRDANTYDATSGQRGAYLTPDGRWLLEKPWLLAREINPDPGVVAELLARILDEHGVPFE